ncbi:MAG TPA: ABC transporter ATP-binding protein [bacterium]|nr:ABC transporter ATP-binding protein [bacterium]HPP08023.1 ABC transporter ATP-binding protein [bacterium]
MFHGPGFHRAARFKYDIDDQVKGTVRITRLFGYLKPYKYQISFALFISICVTVLNLVPPRIIGIIIDRALGKKELSILVKMCFSLLSIYIIVNLLNGVKIFLMGKLGQKITYDLWQEVYRNIQRLSFRFFDENQTGNIMARITSDITAVERVVVDGLDTTIIASLTLVGITFVLFWMNWKLALVTMIPIPLLAFMAYLITVKAHAIYREVRKKMGEISALLQDSISGVRETRSFAREEYEIHRLSTKSSEYVQTNIQAIKLWATFSPSIIITTTIGTFLVLLFGGKMAIINQSISTGEIISFLFYLNLFYQPIHQLNMVNHMLQHARASSERIFEIVDAEPDVKEAKDAVPFRRPIKGEVVFKNVLFSYKPGIEVLHGITFKVNPGETIALVGPTGAGKTTIVSLIPRFYDVDSGQICIDGVDIRKYKLKELREAIGIVMQEPFLFNGTILENIAYGRLDAKIEEIVEAAKLANAHNFIIKLPDGYHHQIGERGVKLSVGEKQRIAIARAILKNPPILIFDEATSSVDNETEALIQEAISRLLKNRTSFVIAHRLSTVMNAHKILVINEGNIVETGTHSELLSKGGLYKKLYEIQFKKTISNLEYFNVVNTNQ